MVLLIKDLAGKPAHITNRELRVQHGRWWWDVHQRVWLWSADYEGTPPPPLPPPRPITSTVYLSLSSYAAAVQPDPRTAPPASRRRQRKTIRANPTRRKRDDRAPGKNAQCNNKGQRKNRRGKYNDDEYQLSAARKRGLHQRWVVAQLEQTAP